MKLLYRQSGISLVELLVSMAIALLILAGVVQTFISSKQSYLYNEQLAFVQENARFSISRMTEDISQAGYTFSGDCPPPRDRILGIADTTLSGVSGLAHGFREPIAVVGYDGAMSNTFPASIKNIVWPGSDAIEVFRASSNSMIVGAADYDPSNARFTLKNGGTHNAKPGTIWTVINDDCSQLAILAQSGPLNDTGNAGYIEHKVSNGADSFNCTVQINTAPNERCFCYPSGHPNEGQMHADAKCGNGDAIDDVLLAIGTEGVGSRLYYLAPSSVDISIPALYQYINGRSEELIIGVDDFQLEYAIGRSEGATSACENTFKYFEYRYKAANDVTNEEWERVGLIQVQLVLRSQVPILPQAEARTYLGVNYQDRYVRQLVRSTIQVKNLPQRCS